MWVRCTVTVLGRMSGWAVTVAGDNSGYRGGKEKMQRDKCGDYV